MVISVCWEDLARSARFTGSQVHRQKAESDTIPFTLSASERYGIEKVKFSLCLMKLHTIQAYGGVMV